VLLKRVLEGEQQLPLNLYDCFGCRSILDIWSRDIAREKLKEDVVEF